MKNYYLFFILIFLITSCSKEKSEEDEKVDDPWSELRDLSPGDVHFDGDYFCYYDCLNDKVLCGQRMVCDCDVSQYHPEFLSYDCFFVTEFNGGNPSDYYEEGDEFGLYFVVCFCGRQNNTYSGTYSLVHNYSSCQDFYDNSPREKYIGVWDGTCGDDCNPCIANCNSRECGTDGCGGSCGTCPPGKTCSTAGICIDEGTGDPCSDCLSTCRGLPGCCTGCGCLCEDECGGCF
jgi:hypothetical protein